jgi:hypothetical protein
VSIGAKIGRGKFRHSGGDSDRPSAAIPVMVLPYPLTVDEWVETVLNFTQRLILAGLCAGVLSCASRDFESDDQSGSVIPENLSAAEGGATEFVEEGQDQQYENGAVDTGLRRLNLSGSHIHESDNKQPLRLKSLVDKAVLLGQTSANFELYRLEGAPPPQLIRPKGGLNSPIGTELYHLRAPSDSEAKAAEPGNREALGDLMKNWLLVASYGSKLGFYQTARYLRDYFRIRNQPGRQIPALNLESNTVMGALQQIGYWSRPDDSTSGLLSLGEQVLRRNRASILLDLFLRVGNSATADRFQPLKTYLYSLANKGSKGQMLWYRTHTLVRPSAGSDWSLALGEFSVLAYSFAHISEVTDRSFRLSIASYDFMYGIHSWSSERTADLLDRWCGADVDKVTLHENQCQALISAQQKLGNPSLAILDKAGLANAFSVSGYSPVLMSSEVIEYSSMTPQLTADLSRESQLPGILPGL